MTIVSVSILVVATAGCGIGPGVLDTGVAEEMSTPIHGEIHGGQQPISGSTISLYVAGQTGYGSTQGTGTAIATTTSDVNGYFDLPTYTCPTGANQLVYLVAKGGDPGAGVNSAVRLMAVLAGPTSGGAITTLSLCSSVKANAASITVGINEVSTVVAINALAQFFNPSTEHIGTSSTNTQGMTNAFNIAATMLSIPAGLVYPTYTPSGATVNGSTTNVTATPEANKIYLIADILSACINSAGPTSTACVTLLGDAVPPPSASTTTLGSGFTFPAATDTLQAAYYLVVNPINATTVGVANPTNMTALFNLATTIPPFASTASQPTDWTVGLTYGSVAGTNSTISEPTNLSVDVNGNVFFLNLTPTYPGGADVGELTAYGGLIGASLTSYAPMTGLTLDANGMGYIGHGSNKQTATFKANAALSDLAQIEDASLSNVTFLPSEFAADGTNLFETSNLTTNPGSIFQVPFQGQTNTPFISSTATTLATYPVNNGHAIAGLSATSPLVVDHNSNVWTTAGNAVYKVPYNAYPSAGATGTAGSTPVSVSGTFETPSALAVDHSNNVWIANTAGGTPADGYLSYYSASAGTVTSDSTNDDGGVNNPAGLAIDGAGNVWVASAGQTSSFAGQTVSEFALVGGTLTPLSPSAGFLHPYSKPGTIAVDPSGNVWIANVGSYATSTVPGTITVILGAASPVVTPLALGLKNNTLGNLP